MNITDFININTFLLIGTILLGMIYLVVFYKRGASQASIDSNDILRSLIEDQKQEILKLRERQHTLGNDMQKLQLSFERLSLERKQLTQLITIALAEHFAVNPEAAKIAQSLVSGTMSEKKGKE